MPDTLDIAAIASLIGDPTRARMLSALMDGRTLTATELALEGEVTASTASSHLSRLAGAGLLAVERQGRHRYFRIAAPDVARAVEGFMSLATRGPGVTTGPREPALRRARVCYDHLAGEAAVRMLDRMRQRALVRGHGDALALTRAGTEWCIRLGIEPSSFPTRRRVCRECLDWSERRMHLAGALGAALLERMLALRHARRQPRSRVVLLSPRGEAFVEGLEPGR